MDMQGGAICREVVRGYCDGICAIIAWMFENNAMPSVKMFYCGYCKTYVINCVAFVHLVTLVTLER